MTVHSTAADAKALVASFDDDELQRRLELGLRIIENSGQRVPLHLVELFSALAQPSESPAPVKIAPLPFGGQRQSANDPVAYLDPIEATAGKRGTADPVLAETSHKRKIATNGPREIATVPMSVDRRNGQQIQTIDMPAQDCCPVPRPLHSSNTANATSQRTRDRKRKRDGGQRWETISSKSMWKTAKQEDKLAASIFSAGKLGGHAFSLNLSDSAEKTLRAHRDPTRLLSTYIAREMKKALGYVLPHSFCFEFNEHDRLHVHGAIVLDGEDRKHMCHVKKALMRAGGRIEGRKASRQCSLRKIDAPEGWAYYLL